MHRVRFIIDVLAIPALGILVRGLLGLWWVALLRIRVVLRRVLLVLLRLLWLLWLVWWLNGAGACMREHGMTGVAVLAVDCVAGLARGAVGYKGISAVSAYPLTTQILGAAFGAGNC